MFTQIFTSMTNKIISKRVYGCVVIVSASLLSACADKKETKNSSDFATVAIKASYEVEVSDNMKAKYVANFEHDGDSLELEGGDKVFVEIESESLALIENKGNGVATYTLNRTESRLASKYNFKLIRESQIDADNSSVELPSAFSLGSPTAATKDYKPTNGKSFEVTWDKRTGGDAEGETFTLRYDFDCRNQSATSNISGKYVEKVTDAGQHTVNLPIVLAKNGRVDNYTSCSRFDVTAIRSSTDGVLDSAHKSGSVIGSQVRVIKGSLSGLQLL